jgi:hypothetical protein
MDSACGGRWVARRCWRARRAAETGVDPTAQRIGVWQRTQPGDAEIGRFVASDLEPPARASALARHALHVRAEGARSADAAAAGGSRGPVGRRAACRILRALWLPTVQGRLALQAVNLRYNLFLRAVTNAP